MRIEPEPQGQVSQGNGAVPLLQQQRVLQQQKLQQLQQQQLKFEQSIELENIGDACDTTPATLDGTADGNGDGVPKKKWIRRPLNKRTKRLRQNRRLRKLLIPKNALMSLHELMGSSISDYRIMPEERGFVAQVLVNNIQYEGRGERSKDSI